MQKIVRNLILGALAACSLAYTSGTPLHKPLFKTSPFAFAPRAGTPDTLEVYCLYVEFKNETADGGTDDAVTTGLGTFGSAGTSKTDPEKDNKYTLDPNGNLRLYRWYLDSHREWAN